MSGKASRVSGVRDSGGDKIVFLEDMVPFSTMQLRWINNHVNKTPIGLFAFAWLVRVVWGHGVLGRARIQVSN